MCRVTLCDERSGLVKMEPPTRLSVLLMMARPPTALPIHTGIFLKPCVLH